jgi:hypothetical protein
MIRGEFHRLMASGRAGGLKNREPLKADDKWPPPKGPIPSVARPGGKGLARRNHEAPLIPWNGRAQPQNHVFGLILRKSNPAGRPGARRHLRKSSRAPGKRAHPADAFCAQCPYPRATTQASPKGQTLRVSRLSRGFTLRKQNHLLARASIEKAFWFFLKW